MRRLTRRSEGLVLAILGCLAALLYFFHPDLGRVIWGREQSHHWPELQDAKDFLVDSEEQFDTFDEKRYLDAKRWKAGEDPYKLYAFNHRESGRVPSNRGIRDTRHYRCSMQHYSANLPATSIIITFHNEARSALLRTVR
ncbi:polypeptide N-acetylgalactosaminyltransferase 14-like, partial [Heptranchias perlo]|uniref:polypeptide N-acetylgalactosaminyltransferase 14-like n=1 Tax=Heptranchias perlo TaxID=212740 RepID=UPI00355AB6EE